MKENTQMNILYNTSKGEEEVILILEIENNINYTFNIVNISSGRDSCLYKRKFSRCCPSKTDDSKR